jgi:hypothetical protein
MLDEATRDDMSRRSDWKGMLTAPLPAPGADAQAIPYRTERP